MSPRSTGGVRLAWIATAALVIAVGTWTILIVATPALRFNLLLPRARAAIETAGGVVALLTSALAYLRLTLTGERTWGFISVAFLLLGANQLAFGVVLPAGRIGAEPAVYFWTAGRLLVAVLLLLGAFAGPLRREPRGFLPGFPLMALGALGVLAAVEVVLWSVRGSLPQLSTGVVVAPAQGAGPLPGLTPAGAVLGAFGTALYLLAAVAYLVPRPQREASAWLAPALVLAAFSHVHYALFPTVFSGYLSTGDLLRLAFSAVLLGGVMWEVRRTFLAEQERGSELAVAYEAERARARGLEELDRAKAKLFAILTHDLLNPVASIRGFAVTLVKRWPDLDESMRMEMVEQIDRESERLRGLAQEASTVVQLETETFGAAPRAERAVEIARKAAAMVEGTEGRLRLRVEVGVHDASVEADVPRILQVFRNLLSNGLKFSPADSPVELRVEAKGNEVVFSVIDQGPGISPNDIPGLFQRFSPVRSPGKESIPGSGLGLYISRQIVEALGGHIWVESEVGEGSAFRFALPRVEVPA